MGSSSPDYQPIYEQAALAGNITAQLPTGTGGAGIGLLVAVSSGAEKRVYTLTVLADFFARIYGNVFHVRAHSARLDLLPVELG